MIPNHLAIRPTLSVLSAEDKRRIDEGALRVLAEIGMRAPHPEALALLARAGCPVDGELVRVPAALVSKAIASAPRSICIYDRSGRLAMDLGDRRSYFGGGSDLLYAIDAAGNRHRCVTEDVRRAAQLADRLPNLDFVMSQAHPSDVHPSIAYLVSFREMVTSTTKPIVCTAEGGADLLAIWRIAAELRGDGAALRQRPYVIHYAEPASPLRHPRQSLDKLLLCADKGLPVVYSPAPIAGSTAPMTIAGHVTQGIAESLFGLVLHQLRSPGAPFIMGMGPAVLDMATIECSYNAPEYYLALMTMIEMIHHYELPSWGYAGTTDSQLPDEQATLEGSTQTFLTALVGSNLNHDVGYLDFGRTGSLELMVIQDEQIGLVRRFLQGIPVDDFNLAVDVIGDAGPHGEFISHAHTRSTCRAIQWRPALLSRLGHKAWTEQGATTLLQRATRRCAELLAQPGAEPVDGDCLARIDRIVEELAAVAVGGAAAARPAAHGVLDAPRGSARAPAAAGPARGAATAAASTAEEQTLQALAQAICDGDGATACSRVRDALAQGGEPLTVVNEGCVPGIRTAGALWSEGEYFLPDLVAAAAAMKAAMELLDPLLGRGAAEAARGTVVLGTAQGDVHDIGKSLVGTLLSANGFLVFDEGADVAPDRFVARAKEVDADLIGVSAMLTTTMLAQRDVVAAVRAAGLKAKVIIGGAPVTEAWAREIDADAYAPDAVTAVDVARALLER